MIGPFKKAYAGASLDEATSLVNEPLPIESANLSPFHAVGINSPLHPRNKDFSVNDVSVSDSLPPNVMELDDSPVDESKLKLDSDNFYLSFQPI